jgi:hypothetical protein
MKGRFRVSGFEESKESTCFHFELSVTEVLIRPGPSDQGGGGGRFAAFDLNEGMISGFGV